MALDLTTLVLAVADDLLGTSATATVSGVTAGATAAVAYARWDPRAGAAVAWTVGGTRVGDGAVAVTPAAGPGFYLWQAWELDGTGAAAVKVGRVVFRPVVDPADPVHARILDAFVTGIRSLNLSGVGGAVNKVFRRWFPHFIPGTDDAAGGGGDLPMVQVGPYGKEVPLGYLTGRDDVGYPVMVGFFDKAAPTRDNDVPRNLKWRRQVAAFFRNQQLAGVPEVVLAEWQPDLIAVPELMKDQYLVGSMAFLVRSRETRGPVA